MVLAPGVFVEIIRRRPVRSRDVRDGVLAVVEQMPVGIRSGGTREIAAQADDGHRYCRLILDRHFFTSIRIGLYIGRTCSYNM